MRGLREVFERSPRGSERFPRGLREVSKRYPKEVSERFKVSKRPPRVLKFPRGLREVPIEVSKRSPRGF